MTTIAFVNQKGGCSKSTTAVHFAYWLAKKRKKVLVVDADAQKSSSTWLESLEHKIPYKVIQDAESLLKQLPVLADGLDFLIVDGPAGLSDATKALLMKADLAVIPCQPTGVDLHSAADTVRLVKQAQVMRGGLPKTTLFLSRAFKGTKLLDEAIAILKKNPEITTLKTIIYQKQVVADTFGQGATVWNLTGRPARESAREYERLFQELMGVVRA